jgi:hypothetical protein
MRRCAMNEQHIGGNGALQYPVASETHQITKWSRAIAIVLIAAVMGLTMMTPRLAFAEDQTSSSDSSEGTGIQVASWLLTIPYCAGKSAFAIAGSVVGGLGYAFSGGNAETAQIIWTKSVYGTYILRPAHLRGEEPIHFVGEADEKKNESVTRAAATPDHANK